MENKSFSLEMQDVTMLSKLIRITLKQTNTFTALCYVKQKI